jgi:hypothetical protein
MEWQIYATVILNSLGIIDITSECLVQFIISTVSKSYQYIIPKRDIPGWHFVTTYFTLEKNEINESIQPSNKKKNGKKQPSKRR